MKAFSLSKRADERKAKEQLIITYHSYLQLEIFSQIIANTN